MRQSTRSADCGPPVLAAGRPTPLDLAPFRDEGAVVGRRLERVDGN